MGKEIFFSTYPVYLRDDMLLSFSQMTKIISVQKSQHSPTLSSNTPSDHFSKEELQSTHKQILNTLQVEVISLIRTWGSHHILYIILPRHILFPQIFLANLSPFPNSYEKKS